MFLVGHFTTPKPYWMKKWIQVTSTLKSLALTMVSRTQALYREDCFRSSKSLRCYSASSPLTVVYTGLRFLRLFRAYLLVRFSSSLRPFRWKWALFVFFGIGSNLLAKIVEEEDRLRNGLGNRSKYVNGERPAKRT